MTAQLWACDWCSLRRFAYSLWFTQPIIALVTADQAPDSRQDSQFNQGSVQQLYQLCSCIPTWVLGSRLNLEFDNGAVTEAGVWKRGRVQENWTYWKPAPYAQVWRGIWGPALSLTKKYFFWLADMQFPAEHSLASS